MKKIIDRILEEIIENFKEYENLISLTLVGSFANPDKKLENFNDVDLVFILKKITEKDIKKLKKLGKDLKKKYSNTQIGITYTLKIGPIKILSKKPKTIMLHFLVYSKKEYTKYESALTRFSFQHYKPLIGKSLKETNRIKQIKKKDLFNEIDGIPTMRKWIKTRIAEYIEPTEEGIKIKSIKLASKQYLEIICYSVLRLASNMVRLRRSYVDIDKKMCEEFSKIYPIELKEFPKEILKLKRKIRKGEKLSTNKIKEIKNKALKFINQCEDFLSKV